MTVTLGQERLADFPTGPFLEVEADEFRAEYRRDVMGAGKAVGGIEDVPAARFEEAADEVEVGADVVGVKMLKKLIAEDDVCDGVWKGKMVAVVNHEFEVGGRGIARGALVGDVHANDLAGGFGGTEAESAVTWGKFYERSAVGEKWSEEADLTVHFAAAFLGGFAAGESRVVRDADKELTIEGLKESGALFPRADAQAGGEFLFDFVVMAETFWGAGHGE